MTPSGLGPITFWLTNPNLSFMQSACSSENDQRCPAGRSLTLVEIQALTGPMEQVATSPARAGHGPMILTSNTMITSICINHDSVSGKHTSMFDPLDHLQAQQQDRELKTCNFISSLL